MPTGNSLVCLSHLPASNGQPTQLGSLLLPGLEQQPLPPGPPPVHHAVHPVHHAEMLKGVLVPGLEALQQPVALPQVVQLQDQQAVAVPLLRKRKRGCVPSANVSMNATIGGMGRVAQSEVLGTC